MYSHILSKKKLNRLSGLLIRKEDLDAIISSQQTYYQRVVS